MKFTILFLLFASVASADCAKLQLQPDGSLRCTDNPNKLRDQVIANCAMIAAGAFDCVSTIRGIRSGKAQEGNPLMKAIYTSYGRCFAVKAAVSVPIAFLAWRRDSVRGQVIVSAMWGGLGVYNVVRF